CRSLVIGFLLSVSCCRFRVVGLSPVVGFLWSFVFCRSSVVGLCWWFFVVVFVLLVGFWFLFFFFCFFFFFFSFLFFLVFLFLVSCCLCPIVGVLLSVSRCRSPAVSLLLLVSFCRFHCQSPACCRLVFSCRFLLVFLLSVGFSCQFSVVGFPLSVGSPCLPILACRFSLSSDSCLSVLLAHGFPCPSVLLACRLPSNSCLSVLFTCWFLSVSSFLSV